MFYPTIERFSLAFGPWLGDCHSVRHQFVTAMGTAPVLVLQLHLEASLLDDFKTMSVAFP